MTVGGNDLFPRQLVIRFWWDGQEHPSIECPLGDFFGLGHGLFKNWYSLPLQMAPEDGRGLNCWWPMPFSAARIEIENQGEVDVNLYFYLDYESWKESPSSEIGRFHALWRRENPTKGWMTEKLTPETYLDVWRAHPNLSEKDNYLILEAEGSGVFVGCHLNVDAFQRVGNDWYGEGDDIFLIDGVPWPGLHGTGTEDYFNTSWSPDGVFMHPSFGIAYAPDQVNSEGRFGWIGKTHLYRWHLDDPVRFEMSLRATIEHGHANCLTLNLASVAYWYMEQAQGVPALPPYEARKPLPDINVVDIHRWRDAWLREKGIAKRWGREGD